MFTTDIKTAFGLRSAQKANEINLCKDIVKEYMKKHNTNKIVFDWEDSDAPCWEYIGNHDGDIKDAMVMNIEFTEEGDIKELELHLYYDCYDVIATKDEILNLDYLDLAEFVNAEL